MALDSSQVGAINFARGRCGKQKSEMPSDWSKRMDGIWSVREVVAENKGNMFVGEERSEYAGTGFTSVAKFTRRWLHLRKTRKPHVSLIPLVVEENKEE